MNVGGLTGLWQLANYVLGCLTEERPDVLLVQEVAFRPEQLLGIEKFWDKMGYKVYEGTHSGYISHGLEKGVICFVRFTLKSSRLLSAGQTRGALLCIDVEGCLVVNSYAFPEWSCQQDQAVLLEEALVSLDWHHHVVVGGDLNEDWSNSWISICAAMNGLDVVPMDTDSTRWNGKKILDYFLVDQGLNAKAWTSQVKIADHKMVVLELDVTWNRENGQRFCGYKNFHKPGWLKVEEWQACFDEAVQLGIGSGWLEVCYDLNHNAKWVHSDFQGLQWPGGGTCPRDRCYMKRGSWGSLDDVNTLHSQGYEQDMVDYGWDFLSRKVIWSLRQACYIALLRIPEGYEEVDEIKKVEDLFNSSQKRGNNHIQERAFPRTATPCSIKLRKLRRRLGRLLELLTQLRRGREDIETNKLCFRLFGGWTDIAQVQMEVKKLQDQIGVIEKSQRYLNIRNWHERIQGSLQAKGAWIQSKKGRQNLSLRIDEQVTQSKRETTAGLHGSWMRMRQKVQWGKEEREENTHEMTVFFRENLGEFHGPTGRPTAKDFAKMLKNVSGCPGLDGWSTFEATTMANNKYLCEAAWEEMALWESCGLAPSSLNDILLLFIPKAGRSFPDGCGEACDFRPLSIFSIFWRAWSSTWVAAESLQNYIQSKLPLGLTASHRGGTGAEALAAVCAHQLDALGYGCTLDFSSCFDTVDLRSIYESLGPNLPAGFRPWFELLLQHWMLVSKWVGSNGYIFEKPICEATGILQGDGASPIILAFVLWQGYARVEDRMKALGGSFFQGIYMDDRTLIAERPDMVEEAILCWQAFAKKRKLIENEKKAQKVSIFGDIPGYSQQMEVLGVIIGNGSWLGLTEDVKQVKRLQKSLHLIKRIGILPEAKWRKMQDIFTFIHGIYSYGWVVAGPTIKQGTMLRNGIMSSVGRLPYGVPVLKRLLLLVHLDLHERVLIRQIRLLARRDLALTRFGLEKLPCQLDFMVYKGLVRFGWHAEDLLWVMGGFSFTSVDCLNDQMWKKISHMVRESIRKWHYDQLVHLKRHEFEGMEIPPFDPWRIQVVRKWIRKDSVALMLATGSLGSGATWKRAQPSKDFPCPVCGGLNMYWDHYWRCWANHEPPGDLMFRRFLWPRSAADFPLMEIFLKNAGKMVEGHRQASKGSKDFIQFSQ